LGLLSSLDSLATLLIIASLIAGFWNAGNSLGSISEIVSHMIDEPQGFGVSAALFYIGLDTWTPAIPPEFLSQKGFVWISWLYPFTGGWAPHFSLWSCLFGILTATLATLILHKWRKASLFKTALAWIVGFLTGYYFWTLLAWHFLMIGGQGIGLTASQVYDLWHSAVSATENPYLQIFFLANIPISFLWLFRRIGRFAL